MTGLVSPLRYPGSKSNLVTYFGEIVKENLLFGVEFVEPYAGGASVSLGLLYNGFISRAILVERDPLLYSFWRAIKECPDDLCSRVSKLSINLSTWKRYQRFLARDALRLYQPVELATACLFFNRVNFSGVLHAGPIGGMTQSSQYSIDCRFNPDRLVGQIQAIAKYRKQLKVHYADAINFLKKRSATFQKNHSLVYIDPPYYAQGRKLYRFHYHDEDHQRLASFIKLQQFPWVVSYDNHPEIKALFRGQKIVPIYLNYAVKQSRRVEELMISNIKLPTPQLVDSKGKPVVLDVAAAS